MEENKNLALEMREVADNINNERAREKVAKHKGYVETNILPYIKNAAQDGAYQLLVAVPLSCELVLVSKFLVDMGFSTEQISHGHSLKISW